jgi:RNA polymerase-binding transcription factor DksA
MGILMASARKSTKKSAAKKKAPDKAASKKPAAKKAAPKKSAPKKAGARKSTSRPAAKKQARKRTTKTAAKASAPKSPFSKKFLDTQQAALVSEREVYLRQATNLKAEADALVLDMDPGDVQFDEESGEGDTVQVERERDLVLSAQALQAVSEIDHALAKFDLGTYGICEVSGDPIPEERLDAIPWARERVEYKVGGLNRR